MGLAEQVRRKQLLRLLGQSMFGPLDDAVDMARDVHRERGQR